MVNSASSGVRILMPLSVVRPFLSSLPFPEAFRLSAWAAASWAFFLAAFASASALAASALACLALFSASMAAFSVAESAGDFLTGSGAGMAF